MQTKTQVLVVPCLVVLTVMAGRAQAQSRDLRTAAVPEVAQELKFDEEQTALVKKLIEQNEQQRRILFPPDAGELTREQRREKYRELGTQRAQRQQQLEKSLGEKKSKRLRQLAIQAVGVTIIYKSFDVSEKLVVTREQLDQVREAVLDLREQLRTAGNDAEARAKIQKEHEARIVALLTDEQKAKWKELVGAPASDELLEKIRTATAPRRRSDN